MGRWMYDFPKSNNIKWNKQPHPEFELRLTFYNCYAMCLHTSIIRTKSEDGQRFWKFDQNIHSPLACPYSSEVKNKYFPWGWDNFYFSIRIVIIFHTVARGCYLNPPSQKKKFKRFLILIILARKLSPFRILA